MQEDDMILPDDFVEDATPEADEPQDPQDDADTLEDEPEAEDTTPADEEPKADPVTPEPQKLKLKYNHEDIELPLEEAAALAQKGLNYEKAVERARQEARDAYIAEQGHVWNGKPITTEAEYKAALQEKELLDKYQDRDLPEEVIQELMESRRDREERKQKDAEKADQEKRDAALNDFLEYFRSVNDRDFDPKKDGIPQEVKAAVDKGQPLKVAYMEYHARELRSQLKIAQQNANNLKKAPVGSVTANGGKAVEPEDDFLAGFNSV